MKLKDHEIHNEKKTRFSVSLTPKVKEDYQFLLNLGYTPAEIGREGVRLFAAKKRAEVPA